MRYCYVPAWIFYSFFLLRRCGAIPSLAYMTYTSYLHDRLCEKLTQHRFASNSLTDSAETKKSSAAKLYFYNRFVFSVANDFGMNLSIIVKRACTFYIEFLQINVGMYVLKCSDTRQSEWRGMTELYIHYN